jgi:hypothetical protein
MPQYAVLMFAPAPADPADATEPERQAHERHGEEIEQLGGRITAAFALQPSTTATSVSGDTVTDGPFLEAKEVIAGFYVFEAADLDTALAIARRNPITQQGGGVEIRPVLDGFVPGAAEG